MEIQHAACSRSVKPTEPFLPAPWVLAVQLRNPWTAHLPGTDSRTHQTQEPNSASLRPSLTAGPGL